MIDVRVQAADFDPGRQIARLGELHQPAIASFVGRLAAPEDVTEIYVDHYPALAKPELARIAAEAESRHRIAGIVLIHRHGRMQPRDRLLFAGAAAAEIQAAQDAVAYLVDKIRFEAPFWRKDIRADGTGEWRG